MHITSSTSHQCAVHASRVHDGCYVFHPNIGRGFGFQTFGSAPSPRSQQVAFQCEAWWERRCHRFRRLARDQGRYPWLLRVLPGRFRVWLIMPHTGGYRADSGRGRHTTKPGGQAAVEHAGPFLSAGGRILKVASRSTLIRHRLRRTEVVGWASYWCALLTTTLLGLSVFALATDYWATGLWGLAATTTLGGAVAAALGVGVHRSADPGDQALLRRARHTAYLRSILR
jgi:hypothetical protein